VSTATEDASGLQIGGIANIARDATGLQLAGIVNVTGGDVAGFQLGGITNVAGGDVAGGQLAGIVNIARGHVTGPQIGLVNVAEDSDAPIGLFNFIKNGRHHVDVWGQETGLVMGGVQLGGKYTHAILGVGARYTATGMRPAYGGGLGVHFPVGERFALDFDLLHHDLAAFTSPAKLVQLSQARLLLEVELADRMRLFAGPTFNVFVSQDPTDQSPSAFGSTTLTNASSPTRVAVWPGLTVGGRAL
jgi:hypothetical protein